METNENAELRCSARRLNRSERAKECVDEAGHDLVATHRATSDPSIEHVWYRCKRGDCSYGVLRSEGVPRCDDTEAGELRRELVEKIQRADVETLEQLLGLFNTRDKLGKIEGDDR